MWGRVIPARTRCGAVRPPSLLVLVLALGATLVPAYKQWRQSVMCNPAFPPSFADFFMRGEVRVSSLITSHSIEAELWMSRGRVPSRVASKGERQTRRNESHSSL